MKLGLRIRTFVTEWLFAKAFNIAPTSTENGRNVRYLIETYFETFRKNDNGKNNTWDLLAKREQARRSANSEGMARKV